ncbi:MAG: methyltransferase domain-containing protein [Nitrososphaerota archaeon]|nr:methyltransferase domain-containing protein [Nitrososphaerota archaeon]
MDRETAGISCCFDRQSQRMFRGYEKKGLGAPALSIAEALTENGLKGSTVLDVGCGFGALALELLRRGASGAVGIDLSPKMIQMASSLAAVKGLSGLASFQVGDGASSKLPSSKMVILDGVLCCYPGLEALIDNSSSAAEAFYAIAVPDDARFATRVLRLFLPLQGLVFGRDGFRFFVHPTRRIREALQANGFRLVSRSPAGWVWSVFVFRRA